MFSFHAMIKKHPNSQENITMPKKSAPKKSAPKVKANSGPMRFKKKPVSKQSTTTKK